MLRHFMKCKSAGDWGQSSLIMTAQLTKLGIYIFWGYVHFNETSTLNGYRRIEITRNGETLDIFSFSQVPIDGYIPYRFTYVCPLQLSIGDEMGLKVFHTKGSSISVGSRLLRALKLGVNMR